MSKAITLPILTVIAIVLALAFHATLTVTPVIIVLFIPGLLLAFSIRFLLEWTLAQAAFWTTRVSAINQIYFFLLLFLSGQIAPLTILPHAIQIAAKILPFYWTIGFPTELLLGKITTSAALVGIGVQVVWLISGYYFSPSGLASGRAGIFGGGTMNYLRLIEVFFRVNVAGELAYRINFFINLFQSVLGLGTALAGFAIIFSFTDSLGGWRPDEILALVGVYVLIGGIIRFAIQPGMEQLIQSVRDGTFDFTLTKPEDAQLITSISRIGIWEIINIFLGFSLLVIALVRLGRESEDCRRLNSLRCCLPVR